MSKKWIVGALTSVLVLGAVSTAYAGPGDGEGLWKFYIAMALAAGFGIALAAAATSFAMSKALTAALEGTARNPEASGKIMTSMIIGMALIEALCIYALVICLIISFKIPGFEELTSLLLT